MDNNQNAAKEQQKSTLAEKSLYVYLLFGAVGTFLREFFSFSWQVRRLQQNERDNIRFRDNERLAIILNGLDGQERLEMVELLEKHRVAELDRQLGRRKAAWPFFLQSIRDLHRLFNELENEEASTDEQATDGDKIGAVRKAIDGNNSALAKRIREVLETGAADEATLISNLVAATQEHNLWSKGVLAGKIRKILA